MMDGTTDVASLEQESLFIRTASKGVVSTHFWSMEEPEGTSGEELFNVIRAVLDDIAKATSLTNWLASLQMEQATCLVSAKVFCYKFNPNHTLTVQFVTVSLFFNPDLNLQVQ